MWLRLLAVAASGMTAVVAGLCVAVRHVPGFYVQRTATHTQLPRRGGAELEHRLLELHDQAHTAGHWQAVFPEEQINDWLAVELPAKFPGLLPEGFVEPRVALEPNQVRVACRYTGSPWDTVVNLRLEVSLADEPNTLAVRLESLRAGLIPLPRQRLVEGLARSAAQADLRLRWAQVGGDPVALVTLGTVHPQAEEVEMRLEQVEIAAGEVRVAGRSAPAPITPPDRAH